jgi:hypothetical protein
MLVDPITVPASAPTPALTFRVIRSDGYGSERRDDAGSFALTINHERGKGADRHYLKISETKDATDPYTGTTRKQVATVSISASIPSFGWTPAQAAALVKALTDTLADADVTTLSWLNFQS